MTYRAEVRQRALKHRLGVPILRGVDDTGRHRVGDNGPAAAAHGAGAPVEAVGDVQVGIAVKGATILVIARHGAGATDTHDSAGQPDYAGAGQRTVQTSTAAALVDAAADAASAVEVEAVGDVDSAGCYR